MDAARSTVVLVEGTSDQIALETLARRADLDLGAERVEIVPIGGATNIAHALDRYGPDGLDQRLAGLCDVAEQGYFERGLERAGFGSDLTLADLERLGFYVCVADLEDELIRSLGTAPVEDVIDVEGELGQFRTFQQQPAWQGQPVEAQLRRWLTASSRRKFRYIRMLVDALDLACVPRPLERVLAHAAAPPG